MRHKTCIALAAVALSVTQVGCLGGSDDDAATAASASCSDLTGTWRVTSWTCNGTAFDLAANGLKVTHTYTSSTAGDEAITFYVPTNQTALYYRRRTGNTASYSGSNITFTESAPAEDCSTDSTSGSSWGPVTTGVGSETCTHSTAAPGSPTPATLACVASGSTITLTITSGSGYGPCSAGETSVETWTKQ